MTASTITTARHRADGRVVRRVAWLTIGLVALAFGVFEVAKHDLSWSVLLGFMVLPDLAMLAGASQPHAKGQLPARAVPLYNLLHRPMWALLLLGAASVGLLDLPWFVAGLGWLAHVGIDRGAGYNLRTVDGWIRG